MSNQQLLLILLGVTLVGIAAAVGFSIFEANQIETSRSAIITDLQTLAGQARQFYLKPYYLGGGNRSFFNIKMSNLTHEPENDNGRYYIDGSSSAQMVILVGVGWIVSDDDSIRVQMTVTPQNNIIEVLN